MADMLGTAYVEITADLTKFQQGLASIDASMKRLSSSLSNSFASTSATINNVTANLNRMRQNLQSVDTQNIKDIASDFRSIDRAVSSANRSVSNIGKNSSSAFTGAAASASDFNRTLERIQRTLLAFTAVTVMHRMYNAITDMVQVGIQYNANLEQTKIGIASLLVSTRDYMDETGKVLSVQDAWSSAMIEAADTQKRFQIESLKTAATFEQLQRAFQEALAPGSMIKATKTQLEDLAIAAVKAASAIGQDLNQLGEELRSIFQGTMNSRNTRMASLVMSNFGLSLAETNKKLRELGASGQLAETLLEVFSGVIKGADEATKTYNVSLSNLKEAFERTFGATFKKTFETAKSAINNVYYAIMNVDEANKKIDLNEGAVGMFSLIDRAAVSLIENLEAVVLGMIDFRKAHPYISATTDDIIALTTKVVLLSTALTIASKLLKFTGVLTIPAALIAGYEALTIAIAGLVAISGPAAAAFALLGSYIAGDAIWEYIKGWTVAGRTLQEYCELFDVYFGIAYAYVKYWMKLAIDEIGKMWDEFKKNEWVGWFYRGLEDAYKFLADWASRSIDKIKGVYNAIKESMNATSSGTNTSWDATTELPYNDTQIKAQKAYSLAVMEYYASIDAASKKHQEELNKELARLNEIKEGLDKTRDRRIGLGNTEEAAANAAQKGYASVAKEIDAVNKALEKSNEAVAKLQDRFKDTQFENYKASQLEGKTGIERKLAELDTELVKRNAQDYEIYEKAVEKLNEAFKDKSSGQYRDALLKLQHQLEANGAENYKMIEAQKREAIATNEAKEAAKAHKKELSEYEQGMKALTKAYRELDEFMTGKQTQIEFEFSAIGASDILRDITELSTKVLSMYATWRDGIEKWQDVAAESLKKGAISASDYNTQMKNLSDATGQYTGAIIALAKQQAVYDGLKTEENMAQLNQEYVNLTGNTRQQINAESALIDTKIRLINYQKESNNLMVETANLAIAKAKAEMAAAYESLNSGEITKQAYDDIINRSLILINQYELMLDKAPFAQQAADIQLATLEYQKYYNQLRQTGSVLEGIAYGFAEIQRKSGTAFDLGVKLANDLNDAIGEVFESVITGERTIEEAFEDMADAILAAIAKIAAQEIVIPVIFSVTGLSGLLSTGTSSSSLSSFSTAAKTATQGSTTDTLSTAASLTKIGDLFSANLDVQFDKLGNWLKSSNSETLKTLGGWINDNNTLLAKIGYTIGGLTSTYFGISNIASGNYATGIGQTAGGIMMLIPSLQGIGAAVSLLSSVIGPLIDSLFKSEKQLTLSMGTIQTSKGLLFKMGDTGLDDKTVDPFVKAINNYLVQWEKSFKVSWKQAINDVGMNWSIDFSEEDLENLSSEEIVGKMTDAILRTYASSLAEQAFNIQGFNMDFLEGLTGKGAFDWDYGELTETITDIFGYFQALEEAGVEVDTYFNNLRNLLGSDTATGEFFKALQTSEETIGETMARVIEGLSVIPDSLQRMDVLMAGIDTGLLATYRDDLASFFSEESIDWIFNTIVTGMKGGLSTQDIEGQIASALGDTISQSAKDMISYILYSMSTAMSEGMTAEEAYDYLSNVYDFAKSLFEAPLDDALADAVENQSFDSFKKTFAESLQDTLIDVVTEVFTSDMLNEIISSVFGTTEGLYKLVEQYVGGEIDAESMISQFSALADVITEKLGAVWPEIEKIIDLINDKLGDAGDTAKKTAQDYEEYYQTIIDTADGVQDLSESMSQLNDWFEEQYEALVKLASGGEDVTAAMGMLWEAYVAQLKSVYEEIMGDWDEVIDDNTLDEYQQRLKELNEAYDKTSRELAILEEAGIDTSVAVARLTEAYNYQYEAIVNDLLEAIYDASQAMTSWAYDIDKAIADITDSPGDWQNVIDDAVKGFWAALDAFNQFGDISYLEDALDWLEKYYSAMQSQIKARYQAEIDELETLRDATEDYYESQISALEYQRDAIEAYYDEQIEALEVQRDAIEESYEAQIDALNEYRDQVEETYDAQIEALEEQLELAEAWADVLDSVREQILDMLETTTNPADVFERLSIAGGEVERLRALYEGATGEEKAAYAQELMDAISTYMGLLGEAYQRPSNEYMAQYQAMLDLLRQIEAEATAQGGETVEELTKRIADLTEEQNAALEAIDKQIEALEEAETAALEAIDKQIESLEETQTAALEAIDSQIEALEKAETAALESIDNQIEALNDAMEAELKALDQTIVEYYQWLKTLGLDTYEATLTDLNSSLQSILEQSRTQTAYDNYYQNESVAWYSAIHSATYDTSLGVGFMIGQLDAIYQRLGSVASYDVGTSYVPETGLALVHKGEAIIPAGMVNGGSASASGDINVNINVNAPGATASDANVIAARIRQEVSKALKSDRTIRKQAGVARI